MKGEAKKLIELIVEKRAKGDPVLSSMTRTKLILKGVNPKRYTEDTEDDWAIISKLKDIAREFQVIL